MKVGIITQYYKSNNYGGNLQAYALVRAVNTYCESAEACQISYRAPKKRKPFPERAKEQLSLCYRTLIKSRAEMKAIRKRDRAVKRFNRECIPHSKTVYTEKNIRDCLKDYEVFLAGSDQIWNPLWYDEVYRLDFVPGSKGKLAYAASIGKTELTPGEALIFQKTLESYAAVSVREEDGVRLLQPVSPVNVEWTLDPTLLLSGREWDELCSERKISGDYVFCYFLGEDAGQRRVAEEYSRLHHLKIVTMPDLLGRCRDCDKAFGDDRQYDVSPPAFLSLIKYADCVFTDSFHASVFSLIYEKQFFVFERTGFGEMSSRIYSLLSLFDAQARFCDSGAKASIQYIAAAQPLRYKAHYPNYERMLKKSLDFLKANIEKAGK